MLYSSRGKKAFCIPATIIIKVQKCQQPDRHCGASENIISNEKPSGDPGQNSKDCIHVSGRAQDTWQAVSAWLTSRVRLEWSCWIEKTAKCVHVGMCMCIYGGLTACHSSKSGTRMYLWPVGAQDKISPELHYGDTTVIQREMSGQPDSINLSEDPAVYWCNIPGSYN